MSIKKASLKGVNWALATMITLLGFVGLTTTGCVEYGTPHIDFKVKGVVVDKTTGKPVKGIRVGYSPEFLVVPEYDPYEAKKHVLTDDKGVFTLKDYFVAHDNSCILPVFIEDVDGELNGLYESEYTLVDFKKALKTKKSKNWYHGEYTVNQNIELTPVENP